MKSGKTGKDYMVSEELLKKRQESMKRFAEESLKEVRISDEEIYNNQKDKI